VKAGWTKNKLGEVCDFEGGSQPPKSEFIFNQQAGYLRFLQIRDFGSEKNITYIRHSKKNRLCGEDDILIGRYGASVGKILTGKAGAYNVALMKTIPNLEILEKSWFYYFLVSDEFQIPLLDIADRSAQAGFSKDDIYNFPVLVPPLEEQRRIVSLLDEAFADIATAKANAEKNLQNADDLFASALASIFSAKDATWEEKTIGQWVSSGFLAKPQDGNHGEIHPTKADYVETGVPFIMAADLMNGQVDTENCRFISKVQSDNLRIGFAKSGDVLLSHKGTIGRVAILSTDLDYVILTPQVTYYRSLDLSRLSAEFLYICLLSPQFQSAMNDIAGAGSTRAYIGITRQMDLKLAAPPLGKQIELAKKLRAIEFEREKVSAIYRQKLTALADLKKSLLHQAFSGQL
jgi:type I restriction enzyme S subunit